jgi:L-ribulokinase
VAVGNVDAHVTVPAAGPVAAGKMVAIMGTSTCHVMNATGLAEVPGMCGVVDGGIVAGLWDTRRGKARWAICSPGSPVPGCPASSPLKRGGAA